ncbi:MAG TPA: ribosomal protein S18-alanine N-acetyltransferase [Nitrospiraceae bacterium]|nr:ribosomal protein S18-alanine N-acetyltransferase [Nitrospiraceae bacterium]
MAREVKIVPATIEMLPEILRLEEACFSAPWTRKMLEAELTGNQFAHFLVALDYGDTGEEAGTVVGYHCFWIVFEELRLMNLAVRESMRRRGIGRALVTEAIRMGLAQATTRAVLEVRASNQAARTLYRQMGFAQISTRPKYYTNPVEDAVLMEMDPLVMQAGSRQDREPVAGGGSVSAH